MTFEKWLLTRCGLSLKWFRFVHPLNQAELKELYSDYLKHWDANTTQKSPLFEVADISKHSMTSLSKKERLSHDKF